MMRAGLGGWVVLVLLGLTACGAAPEDELQQWMAQQRQQSRARIKPIAAPKPFKPESYVVANPQDPFSPGKLTVVLQRERDKAQGSDALIAPELKRRKEPLEEMPLDALTLVGTMVREGQPVALVRAGNQLHTVRVGQHLGQNYGRVLRITEAELALRELVQDAAGDWVERSAGLQLQQRSK